MTPLIRITPSVFQIPPDDGGYLKAQNREKDMDDSDRVGSLFLKDRIGETGNGGSILRSVIQKMEKDANPPGATLWTRTVGFSQRMGPASSWAHILMSLKGDPFEFAVFSLEDLGFTDPEVTKLATVKDLLTRAEGMGLKTCPHGLMAALVLAQPVVKLYSTIAVMTEPVHVYEEGLYYWSLKGCGMNGSTVVHRLQAYPECQIRCMEEDGLVFGSYDGKLNIPPPNKLGFLYVVPPNFRLPSPVQRQEIIETKQLARVAALEQKPDNTPIFQFPGIEENRLPLISITTCLQDAMLV